MLRTLESEGVNWWHLKAYGFRVSAFRQVARATFWARSTRWFK